MELKLTGKLKNADHLVALVPEGFKVANGEMLSDDLKKLMNAVIKEEKLTFKKGETVTTRTGLKSYKKLTITGIGKSDEVTHEQVRRVAAQTMSMLNKEKSVNAVVCMPTLEKLEDTDKLKAMSEGFKLANYKFDQYKSDSKESVVKQVLIVSKETKVFKAALHEGVVLSDATIAARNLVNEPANVMTPSNLAKEAKKLGKDHGFEVDVKSEKEIEKLGMKAYMSVARAAAEKPKLIVMRYMGNPKKKKDILGLVGKGLTYDTGGLSLKPTDSMKTMKCDMGGSAAVIGAMTAIAEMKLKVNVVAVVAACENSIGNNAYRPGDIIDSMGGKTIEVLNTDAEGRLTLIDAVHYSIEKEKVTKVIDVATLTGAVLVCLGTTTTGVVSNNDEFFNALNGASETSGEQVWRLPNYPEYKELIKSDVADLKNIGGRWAGTITAGLFVGEFVQDKPWLHLDIAGTAWADAAKDYISKGGTGAGVRLLYHLAQNM